jgi:hypothetical protein
MPSATNGATSESRIWHHALFVATGQDLDIPTIYINSNGLLGRTVKIDTFIKYLPFYD